MLACPCDIKVAEQEEQFLPGFILEKPFVSFLGSWENFFCLKISFLLIANTVHDTFPALTLLQHPGSAGSGFALNALGGIGGERLVNAKGVLKPAEESPE